MSEWQPIETAPKTGEWVLCFVRHCDFPVVAHWGGLAQRWIANTEHYEVKGDAWLDDTLGPQDWPPTHWMPIPAPPQGEPHGL